MQAAEQERLRKMKHQADKHILRLSGEINDMRGAKVLQTSGLVAKSPFVRTKPVEPLEQK